MRLRLKRRFKLETSTREHVRNRHFRLLLNAFSNEKCLKPLQIGQVNNQYQVIYKYLSTQSTPKAVDANRMARMLQTQIQTPTTAMRLPERLHKHKCPSFIGETCPQEGKGQNEAASSPISPEISLPFLTTRSVNMASLNHTILERGWPNKQHISPSTLRFNKPPGCELTCSTVSEQTSFIIFSDEHIRIFPAAGRWVTWWQIEPEAQVFAGSASEALQSHIKSQRCVCVGGETF